MIHIQLMPIACPKCAEQVANAVIRAEPGAPWDVRVPAQQAERLRQHTLTHQTGPTDG